MLVIDQQWFFARHSGHLVAKHNALSKEMILTGCGDSQLAKYRHDSYPKARSPSDWRSRRRPKLQPQGFLNEFLMWFVKLSILPRTFTVAVETSHISGGIFLALELDLNKQNEEDIVAYLLTL